METRAQRRSGRLEPFYEQVQAHYDLCDDFFALFLDPSRTYSCGYFERADMTLEEAQHAKIDLTLGKCDLRPGMWLLDIGCGWGALARHAAEKFGAHVIGLTLSANQHAYARRTLTERPVQAGRVDFRLSGWEQFDEPVDRIVSVGAFEHFRTERYAAFFARCRALLPASGQLVLHTIVWPAPAALAGKPIEHEHVLFGKFIRKHIFPGGQLCQPETIVRHAEQAGFGLAQTQSLQLHYARTLEHWAANLRAARGQAIALTSEDIYDRYMHYLSGCARYFAEGYLDVLQFTLKVTGLPSAVRDDWKVSGSRN